MTCVDADGQASWMPDHPDWTFVKTGDYPELWIRVCFQTPIDDTACRYCI
jgi:hypothetical protein